MMLFLLLACDGDAPDTPTCGDPRQLDGPECPCRTAVYSLTRWNAATCRTDQTAHSAHRMGADERTTVRKRGSGGRCTRV